MSLNNICAHNGRPSKGAKRKTTLDYATQYFEDLFVGNDNIVGTIVLKCRFCPDRTIKSRSDRIKEHLQSITHNRNKMLTASETSLLEFDDMFSRQKTSKNELEEVAISKNETETKTKIFDNSTPAPTSSHEQQLVCIKWSDFDSNRISSLSKYRREGQFTDVTLRCENKTLRCHRNVIAAGSSILEQILIQTALTNPVLILENVRFQDLETLVEFMYNGEVCCEMGQLNSLFQAAEVLQIKGLCSAYKKIGLSEETEKATKKQKMSRVRRHVNLSKQSSSPSFNAVLAGDIQTSTMFKKPMQCLIESSDSIELEHNNYGCKNAMDTCNPNFPSLLFDDISENSHGNFHL